jgi:hypothetical protein
MDIFRLLLLGGISHQSQNHLEGSMSNLFKKLNLKDQKEVLILNVPKSFEREPSPN